MTFLNRLRAFLHGEITRVRVLGHDIAVRRVHLTTLLLAVAVATVVAFTGGLFTGHYIWKPSPQQIHRSCPTNRAQLGCVVKLYAQHDHAKVKDPAGPHFPDVSSWQGHPNWAAAKPSIVGAIVKAFEYSQDPDFSYNASSLTRLHVPWGAYLFVRGCGYAPAFASTVRPWIGHISVLVLDMEVPAARGCAPELAGVLHKDFPHTRLAIYASPGAYPGGSSAGLDAWVASYGPSHPPCLFTCHVGPSTRQTILGWQLTDGTYGYRIYTPGIGYGDESLNYGMFTKPAPAKPRLICFGAKAQVHNKTCQHVRTLEGKRTRAAAASHQAAVATAKQISVLQHREAAFAKRAAWFAAHAASLLHQYS